MRRGIMAAGFLLAGVLTMSPDGDAGQEKKDEKWPDRVTVRRWIASQKEFLDPVKDVKAKFKELGKKEKFPVWQLHAGDALAVPEAGTEITDKDGVVWKVTKVTRGDEDYLCYVEKKDPPKKD